MADGYVVDASVAIKLFVDEEDSDQAHALFNHLLDEHPLFLIAPDLLFLECANVLWKYVHRHGYRPDIARSNLRDLGRLDIRTVPARDLFSTAFDEAHLRGITVYDACYVTLAQQIEHPFVTADRKLVDKLTPFYPWILHLGSCHF